MFIHEYVSGRKLFEIEEETKKLLKEEFDRDIDFKFSRNLTTHDGDLFVGYTLKDSCISYERGYEIGILMFDDKLPSYVVKGHKSFIEMLKEVL